MSITAQVTRTHPVHPELVSGTFICLDCQTVIKNVLQQFKVWCHLWYKVSACQSDLEWVTLKLFLLQLLLVFKDGFFV